ncbi:MAG TPA: hypothetical protein VG778_00805 [Blastocatellia bacterium]|jgi:hypothetical protein|nr:hypothetical protein [Blastocatellia bacterium]
MLHIHNGDSTAVTARQSSLPGEHIAWREALVDGPTPAGLSADSWREVRAKHLADGYSARFEECLREWRELENHLARSLEHEEAVLWFEHDLFCQINLLYLLDWFSKHDRSRTKLSLIFIGEFPGKDNFRGLGELNADQLASLFDKRVPVTEPMLDAAQRAWAAYCSPNPQAIEETIANSDSVFPFLSEAFALHLLRFPSIRNGLGRVENTVLELVSQGHHKFKEIFPRFWATAPRYGLGDAQVWNQMKRLVEAREALLVVDGLAQASQAQMSEVMDARFDITEHGSAVLGGRNHFVRLNGIDLWLGGVHLTNANLWEWDEDSQKLVRGNRQ